jgi:predicted Fe-S protein YdhL (DUF1289 family)
MKLQEIKEIANDTGVHAERGYHLKNFANRIVELDRQQRPWVGLTDEERRAVWDSCERQTPTTYVKAIEAKLKEKNNG